MSASPLPYLYYPATLESPILIVCDHASAAMPDEYAPLSPDDAKNHISHDIGAAQVCELLAERLNASRFIARYSRLLVDLNRASDCADVIAETSDGKVLTFNQNLSESARAVRLMCYHLPYHAELNTLATDLGNTHGPRAFGILVHSFTPRMDSIGEDRPWQIGLLWRDDPDTAQRMISWLNEHSGYVVGDNQPYSGHSEASYTMRAHFGALKIPHVALEIRQDLIATQAGQQRMADLLTRAVQAVRK